MDWGRMPADTMVVESKNIVLRDIVQVAADGVDTREGLVETLGLTGDEEGAENLQPILDVFLPLIARLRSGGCGGG
ncbi:MAG: hypothetical protein ACOX5A_03205 [Aminivibrio sp.]|nr:hypothetical protein [Synergistaceae bacterium]